MIYLDNASTTYPKPQAVIDAVHRYMTELGVSPGRGGYRCAVEMGRIVGEARTQLAALVNGSDPTRMIFTASCTDALNMAFHGVLREGDHVITSMLEHNSVNRPLQALANAGFIVLTRVPFDGRGVTDPDDIRRALTPATKLVVLNHASNVTGVIQPAAEVGALVRAHGALFLMDAAQTIGVLPIDVEALCADLLAFPTHKELLAPQGLGGLYVGSRAEMRPWRQGGTGADSITPVQPAEWPAFLEAGTPNSPAIVGLHAALAEIKPGEMLTHLQGLTARLADRLMSIDGVRILGDSDPKSRVGTVAVVIDGVTSDEAMAVLNEPFGICARSGLHCAPYAHRQLGTFPDGAVRFSPGPFTAADEIDRAADAVAELVCG